MSVIRASAGEFVPVEALAFLCEKSKEGLPGMPLLKKLAAVFYICYSSFAVRRQSAFLSIQFQAFRRYILKDQEIIFSPTCKECDAY